MIDITLPDGSVRNYESGVTAMEVAKDISEGFARNVLSASFNGQTVETSTPITASGDLVLYTWNDEEGKTAFRHSTAHVLAQTLLEFYPDAKLSIGPAIENGFYYDVDLGDKSISEKDFGAIEKRMLEIARGKHEFNKESVSKEEALSFYKEQDNRHCSRYCDVILQ